MSRKSNNSLKSVLAVDSKADISWNHFFTICSDADFVVDIVVGVVIAVVVVVGAVPK